MITLKGGIKNNSVRCITRGVHFHICQNGMKRNELQNEGGRSYICDYLYFPWCGLEDEKRCEVI